MDMRKSPIFSGAKMPERQMNLPGVRLIDILMPPGNRWLTELSSRRELPAGVRIVRFGNDDDGPDEAADTGSGKRHRRRRDK